MSSYVRSNRMCYPLVSNASLGALNSSTRPRAKPSFAISQMLRQAQVEATAGRDVATRCYRSGVLGSSKMSRPP